MLSQSEVDQWLAEFLARLKDRFSKRLVFVGHHGSWGRGEPRPESDIDCMVVVDHIEDLDLVTFRDIVSSMPDAEKLGSGIFLSVAELKQIPRSYLVQFFHGREVLYGSIEGVIAPPTREDLIEDIKFKADANLHTARDYLLYPNDLSVAVHKLKYHFKNCFYALQSWSLLTKGEFIPTKNQILEYLDDANDAEVIRVARDWFTITDDLTARAPYYIELLERWARGMQAKLKAYLSNDA